MTDKVSSFSSSMSRACGIGTMKVRRAKPTMPSTAPFAIGLDPMATRRLTVAQPREDPLRGMAVLRRRRLVVENLLDEGLVIRELRTTHGYLAPAPGRRRIRDHLRDGTTVDAETRRGHPLAQPLQHHRTTDKALQFHVVHPPASGAFDPKATSGRILHRHHRPIPGINVAG
jgi:hypothetical protein